MLSWRSIATSSQQRDPFRRARCLGAPSRSHDPGCWPVFISALQRLEDKRDGCFETAKAEIPIGNANPLPTWGY
jgi:hypothetical protein